MIEFLVTTRLERLQQVTTPIIMVDGTVPGWKARSGDVHYDHHRPGGAEIQIDEIPLGYPIPENSTLVTTMIDADACVAAAYLLLEKEGVIVNKDSSRRLKAIAYDCDHLAVPEFLADLGSFAAQAVAALKESSNSLVTELELPADRKQWSIEDKELFSSKAFQAGTQWLMDAVEGKLHWPGECGEANNYWKQVQLNTQRIINEQRITLYRNCLLFDAKGMGGEYIDPRCWLKAAKLLGIEPANPITLIQREVIVESEFKGFSYTLGVIPLHFGTKMVDYTETVFKDLSALEKKKNPNADEWGGRKTVGGSGWNTPSNLTPTEIIDCVLDD